MAMGFSTQTSPFRPSYCPPYFWICHSCPRSYCSSMASSSSSRSIWASTTKTLHRREICTLQSASCPCTITMFSSSFHFKQGSSHNTMLYGGNYRHDDTKYYCSPSALKLHVPVETVGPTSYARMLPMLPNQFSSGRKISIEGSLLEHKKHEDYFEKSSMNTSPEGVWLEAREKVREMRRAVCRDFNISTVDCGIQSRQSVEDNETEFKDSENGRAHEVDHPIPVIQHKPSTRRRTYVKNNGNASVVPGLGYGSNIGSSSPIFFWPSKNPFNEEERKEDEDNAIDAMERTVTVEKSDVSGAFTEQITANEALSRNQPNLRERLGRIYDKVFLVDNFTAAKEIVGMLTNQYRHLVHACDTEVAKIDVKQETPVDHGEIICFSIYPGPEANFGNGKSCVWVDVLDGGGRSLLAEFAPFFEDPSIKKVWHNYSFDNHVIENYGLKLSGFHADTMHMARLWDSSRQTRGGYSLEALTGDPYVMNGAKSCVDGELMGKVSMKTIFGRRKLKKDGSEGKLITIPPVEVLQKEERKPWICYSALDSITTLELYKSMKCRLSSMEWKFDGVNKGTMFDFYEKYWRPFGELLVKMETEGMLVDRDYLAEVEKVAKAEQQVAASRFRNWASKLCPDAK